MNLDSFDYELPPELIAQEPSGRRDESRLMIVERGAGRIVHGRFHDLLRFLAPADCLVLNDTRVLPARLVGRRSATGGKWEGLFLGVARRNSGREEWRLLCRTRGKLREGEEIEVEPPRDVGDAWQEPVPEGRTADPLPARLILTVIGKEAGGFRLARAESGLPALTLLEHYGRVPLPPYIKRRDDGSGFVVRGSGTRGALRASEPGTPDPEPACDARLSLDRERYQTVFARVPGAVAAPTAGLHFTPELLERIRGGGTGVVFATLHVGPGTFQPITASRIEDHRMHAEWGCLSPEAAAELNHRRAAGGRVVAVGTTCVRVLETAAQEADPGLRVRGSERAADRLAVAVAVGPAVPARARASGRQSRPYADCRFSSRDRLQAWSGSTDLYIHPPYRFRAVDALITNFHLPRTSLLVLVATLLGTDLLRAAYAEAIRERYRFYSYGDAMLIL